jgi:hypothetical protein
MVWLALSSDGIFNIERVDRMLDAARYFELACGNVLAAIHAAHGTDFVLQKNNASPHRARSTLEAFQAAELRTLPWPALSSDINPDENVWALLLRRATTNARRYNSEDELWRAIQNYGRRILHTSNQPLTAGVPNRLIALLE